jgi:hypothetical protein
MTNEISHSASKPKASRKEVVAVVLGAAVEFFDFSAYATFAVMIGNIFFPSDNPFTSLLLSVSVLVSALLSALLAPYLLAAMPTAWDVNRQCYSLWCL